MGKVCALHLKHCAPAPQLPFSALFPSESPSESCWPKALSRVRRSACRLDSTCRGRKSISQVRTVPPIRSLPHRDPSQAAELLIRRALGPGWVGSLGEGPGALRVLWACARCGLLLRLAGRSPARDPGQGSHWGVAQHPWGSSPTQPAPQEQNPGTPETFLGDWAAPSICPHAQGHHLPASRHPPRAPEWPRASSRRASPCLPWVPLCPQLSQPVPRRWSLPASCLWGAMRTCHVHPARNPQMT